MKLLLLLICIVATTKVAKATKATKVSSRCLACSLVTNELEGFLLENRTETEIMTYLGKVCSDLPFKAECNKFVSQLPHYFNMMTNRWNVSRICTELKFCDKPLYEPKDPQPVPSFKIDLKDPPIKRWHYICSMPKYQKAWKNFIGQLNNTLGELGTTVSNLGRIINSKLPTEYGQEITGCANALFANTSRATKDYYSGWLTILNVGYEISDGCTSIVAKNKNGTIIHGRNMDFWDGGTLTNTLRDVAIVAQVYDGDEPKFVMTTFVGFIGVLSGQKLGTKDRYSVTVDTRYYPKGIKELFYEAYLAITQKGYSLVSLLTRDVLTNVDSYDVAVNKLSNTPLIADVYYIVAGTKDGVVISRNRTHAVNTWSLSDKFQNDNLHSYNNGTWFVLETNYDHWKPAPWFDDRRGPAIKALNQIGQNKLSIDTMYKVLSTKPVLNIQTVYSFLSVPSTGHYSTFVRYCKYPCVQ